MEIYTYCASADRGIYPDLPILPNFILDGAFQVYIAVFGRLRAALVEINYPATLPVFTVHITLKVIGITQIFFHIMALNPSQYG
jgi:hypothetical protein